MAAAHGHPESVRLLLDSGADPGLGDGNNDGLSSVGENIRRHPMPLASLECRVSELFHSDACTRPTTGHTPLMLAAASGHLEVLRLMLARGTCQLDAATT